MLKNNLIIYVVNCLFINVGDYVLPVNNVIRIFKEEFEDTKGTISIRISKKNDNAKVKRKSTKGQTTIYKTYI